MLGAAAAAQLAAENLFRRKQLALYLERQVEPRRAEDATRITLVALSGLVPWRELLTIVKPDTADPLRQARATWANTVLGEMPLLHALAGFSAARVK